MLEDIHSCSPICLLLGQLEVLDKSRDPRYASRIPTLLVASSADDSQWHTSRGRQPSVNDTTTLLAFEFGHEAPKNE